MLFPMPSDSPPKWRRIRSGARVALGVACLTAQIVSPASILSPVTLVCSGFVLYGLVALLWKGLEELQSSIAGLILETAFFISFAAYGADWHGWIGSALFVYLATSASLGHSWIDVLVTSAAPLVFFWLVQAPAEPALMRVVALSGVLACVLADSRARLERRLSAASRAEAELRSEIEKIRDHERQRIAGDFHDGPLQSFIALQVRLDILATLLKRDRAAALEDLKDLQQMARQQVAEIRSFLRSMKRAEVDTSGDLIASARRIVEYFQKDTGISARFISTASSLKAPDEVGHETLQILRESLNNVQKHSKAGRVIVSVEQNGREIELSISDDGQGFSFSGNFSLDELDLLRLGPQSIKRRVRSLSGELQIESRPGHGATLTIRVPY
jgi:signal transduction histidine kinase